jgi:CHAT domain-containing protein
VNAGRLAIVVTASTVAAVTPFGGGKVTEPVSQVQPAFAHDSVEVADALEALAGGLRSNPAANLAEGLACARAALEMRERLDPPDSPRVADALEGWAMWLWYADDLEEMLRVVDRAYKIRRNATPRNDVEIARLFHFYADYYRRTGDFGRSLEYRDRALALYTRTLGPESESVALQFHYRGEVQAAIGDLPAAIASAMRAVEIRESLQADQLPVSLNLLGRLLVKAGKLDEAESLLDRALRMWEAGGSPAIAARAMMSLGHLHAAREDWPGAALLFTRAVAIRTATLRPDDPVLGRTYAELGAVERRRHSRATARAFLVRALEIEDRRVAAYPDWASTLRELALLDASEGRFGAALSGALEAERLSREHFRYSAVGLTEREAMSHVRGRRGGLDLAWRWAVRRERSASLGEQAAFDVLDETIRSRTLVLETLATRQRVLSLHDDPETRDRVEVLLAARRRLVLALSEESEGSALPPEQLQAEVDRAERGLADRSRAYEVETERGRIGLEGVLGALPAASSLVSYYRYAAAPPDADETGPAAYAASLLVPGERRPRIVPLGDAADIDAAVRAWQEEASRDPRPRGLARSDQAYRRAARRLAQKIWDPIARQLPQVERIFVVPDGALHQVQLAALVSPDGRLLIESGRSFQYLTAERDLVAHPRSRANQALLAVGDPDYGDSPSLPGPFDPLPSSRREAVEVADLWTSRGETKRLIGEQATEAAFKREAPKFGILHIATHAFYDSRPETGESPLRVTGLALAAANRRPSADTPEIEDGILDAEEIALLDLGGVEWAVLSACATGAGALEPGEGVLGLRRAFQIAGARSLIVSLWPVDDDATRRWMRHLYASRRAGATTIDAVRDANLAALEEQRRAFGTTHPYFWGGFISIGDWR